MKKNGKRWLSLLMAFTVFATSSTIVFASETGNTATEPKTAESTETAGNTGSADGAGDTGTADNAGNTNNAGGAGTSGNAAAPDAGTNDQPGLGAGTEGNTAATGDGASNVEGEIIDRSNEDSKDNSDKDNSGKDNSDQTKTPEVQGSIIVDENNDDVEIKANDRPYLSLGADLSEEQRATVLSIMGINPADLGSYDVVYVTNAEEHQYLDSYISSSQIGSRSLSSVVIMERKKGNGLNISTNNITYCTVGMYKNALTTAGITDADIIVAGPAGISGTAALVGIFKAYQEMTGETIDDSVMDAALNELVITGQLEASIEGLSNEEVEEFIAYIKSVIAKNDLSDEASINEAIDEACEKYGVTLSDEERQQIVDLLLKITSLGIDLNGLVDYAASLYNSFKNGGGDTGVLSSIGNFFSNVFTAIGDFFKNLFS